MTGRRTHLIAVATAVALAMSITACGNKSSSGSDGGKATLTYALWDDQQAPGYQKCLDAFTQANPGITVKMTQIGWDEYWTQLSTQMAAGKAPDVFTNHVARYPQLQANKQLMDLTDAVTKEKVDLGQYRKGLADLWVRDGKRFGLPKDFDTIGLFANVAALSAAGFDPAQAAELTWNPTDGGTFEKLIASLSVDATGKKGTDPGFDAANVKTYGLYSYDPTDGYGQTWWANFALSNGFRYADTNPFPKALKYDDPKLAQTLDWYQRMVKKGFIPAPEKVGKLGRSALLDAGTVAMVTDGSWGQAGYAKGKTQVTTMPLPKGPEGRKSVLNGLADSVFAGTKKPAEAKKLALFLGSTACQDKVAEAGAVFPAINSSAEKAVAAMKAKFGQSKIDPQVFLTQAEDPEGTGLYPILDKGIDVNKSIGDVMDRIMAGKANPNEELSKVNTTVNGMLK